MLRGGFPKMIWRAGKIAASSANAAAHCKQSLQLLETCRVLVVRSARCRWLDRGFIGKIVEALKVKIRRTPTVKFALIKNLPGPFQMRG
jgi:hypothetical protein